MTKVLADYTSEDFLNDDRFIKWVKYQDSNLGHFWNSWLLTNPSNKLEFDNAVVQLRLMLSVHPVAIKQEKLDAVFMKIETEIDSGIPVKIIKYNFLRYAAAVLIPLLIFSAFYLTLKDDNIGAEQQAKVLDHNRAKLILSDGSTVLLGNNDQNIEDASGSKIEKDSAGLRYADQTGATTIAYNTIEVPRGAEYRLVLTDGTQIWLNSETKLRYPAKVMPDGDRNVYLENGEAYFQVTKNKHAPFLVNLNGMQVEVLGTSFNVNTFNNVISTTLEEGNIRVNRKGKASVYQVPGEQTIFSPVSEELTKAKVDTYPFTSWKDGWLVFNDNPLEEVMEQVGRWYDMQVEYTNPSLKTIRFGGKLRKVKSVKDILTVIERSNELSTRILGGKIIISERKPATQ
ncbi:DUF4974 domain-containing protein [Pedobacter frigidisoli]|uniref:DUF4974 domain-containing protein n=1 Tax=Pedobacter frigidisoli TaxID=2530455 RepID=A0A4R0P7T8_9SPHI|nr:FecR domain-containing protein [Pedobacter frigidisoli]TCD11612.1 DUF4974 domain-containing protein [Pedobacter frigidisoli]